MKKCRRHFPTLVLTLAAGLVSAPGASATGPTVAACVLDGGGAPSERACGIEMVANGVQSSYKRDGVTPTLTVLTGSGRTGEVACNANADAGGRTGMVTTQSYDSGLGKIVTAPTVVPVKLTLKNPPFPLAAATPDSFAANCLYDSNHPPAHKVDVCNFWSFNHGAPDGIPYYKPDASQPDPPQLTGEKLGQKAAGCENFRYVTSNCYGEQLSKSIYGTNGRVAEGRCGMSGSPRGWQAQGNQMTMDGPPAARTVATRMDQLGSVHSTKVDVRPAIPTYGLMASMASTTCHYKDAGRDPGCRGRTQTPPAPATLDTMSSDARLYFVPFEGLQVMVGPTLSSDSFLEDTAPTDKRITAAQKVTETTYVDVNQAAMGQIRNVTASHEADISRLLSCSTSDNGLGPIQRFTAEMGATLGFNTNNGLSQDEKDEIKFQLQTEAQRLADFKTGYCQKFPEDPPTKPCDFNGHYKDFVEDREKAMQAYTGAKDAVEQSRLAFQTACRQVGLSTAGCTDAGLMRYLRNAANIACPRDTQSVVGINGVTGNVVYSLAPGCSTSQVAAAADKVKAALGARKDFNKTTAAVDEIRGKIDQFLLGSNPMLQFERAKVRFARVLDLIKSGNHDHIADYLLLRRCEMTDMAQPVPRSWQAFKAQH